jgi:2-dehydropantoate 2-reductase
MSLAYFLLSVSLVPFRFRYIHASLRLMTNTPNKKYKIAVVGSGAIGAFYGAALAKAGHDVHFLLRGDLDVVRQHGFRITTPETSYTLHPVQAHARTEEIGACDFVIVALKSTANSHLAQMLPPLDTLGHTVFITLQNGMGNVESLASMFGAERVVAGLCFVCVNRVAAGVIENYQLGRVQFAEAAGPARARTHEIAEMFSTSGAVCKAVDSLIRALWFKLCWNVPFNGLAIVGGGITTDLIVASPPLKNLATDLMREVAAAAAKDGVEISEKYIVAQIAGIESIGAYRPSSLIDYLAGRPVEVEAIWGEPLRRGTANGVKMDRLAFLCELLRHLCAHSSVPDASA